MKLLFTIGISLSILAISMPLYACDACGGIVMSQNDIDFSFNSKISFTSSWNRYQIANEDDQLEHQQSDFYSNQLKGVYAFKSKVLFSAMLPINGVVRHTQPRNGNWGLGDLTLSSYVNLLVKQREDKTVRHNLNAGVGMIFPTGKKSTAISTGTENLNLQLSAESWSWFGKLDYLVQIKKWSIAQTNSISVYAKNKDAYQYGNILVHGLKTQVQIPIASNDMGFHPFMVTSFEHAAKNRHNGFLRNHTGYNLLSLSGGMIWTIKNNSITFVYSQPLWQKQNNNLIKKQSGVVLSYAYKF